VGDDPFGAGAAGADPHGTKSKTSRVATVAPLVWIGLPLAVLLASAAVIVVVVLARRRRAH
jgi:hypothetical protein